MPEPFFFGIPLIARESSQDWPLVEALLSLTLRSVLAQGDPNFRVIVTGHDRPTLPHDGRIAFVQADWPAEPVRGDNLDSGRKKFLIGEHVLAAGGGLLMYLDADDWVDTGLVATARARIGPEHIGGLIETGLAVDIRSLRAAALPHAEVFDGGFHRLCGSSTIARLRPEEGNNALRRNPHAVMHEHYRWLEVAKERQVTVVSLPVGGAYVINSSANHSEIHGPFAAWRRSLCDDVNRHGSRLTDLELTLFGLTALDLQPVMERFVKPRLVDQEAGQVVV